MNFVSAPCKTVLSNYRSSRRNWESAGKGVVGQASVRAVGMSGVLTRCSADSGRFDLQLSQASRGLHGPYSRTTQHKSSGIRPRSQAKRAVETGTFTRKYARLTARIGENSVNDGMVFDILLSANWTKSQMYCHPHASGFLAPI